MIIESILDGNEHAQAEKEAKERRKSWRNYRLAKAEKLAEEAESLRESSPEQSAASSLLAIYYRLTADDAPPLG